MAPFYSNSEDLRVLHQVEVSFPQFFGVCVCGGNEAKKVLPDRSKVTMKVTEQNMNLNLIPP